MNVIKKERPKGVILQFGGQTVSALLVLWMRRRKQAMSQGIRLGSEAEQTPSLRELLENPDLMTAQGELSVLEEQLRNYAINNPEEFANLIKSWVVDDV